LRGVSKNVKIKRGITRKVLKEVRLPDRYLKLIRKVAYKED